MKNSIGTSIILTLFGESHQNVIGAVLDGFPAGRKVDEEFVKEWLAKRRPSTILDTGRVEPDDFEFVSGVFNGYTTGSPICVLIKNQNVKSEDYDKNLIRPSHADYVSKVKYGGYADYRGGGHFSGRITAPIVALGALCIKALEDKGIKVGTHILKCADVCDKEFKEFDKEIALVNNKQIPVIDNIEDKINEAVLEAKKEGDSLGGILQTAITGLPVGIGEPWFSSLEGILANAMFSIGGVKGIEFGKGFGLASLKGSEANDALCYEKDKVVSRTNNNGGINGGISNGMPIVFNVAIKPTPSIAKEQDSVDLENKCDTKVSIKGRHDPAIIRRVAVVVTSLTAIVLCDELAKRYGEDYLK